MSIPAPGSRAQGPFDLDSPRRSGQAESDGLRIAWREYGDPGAPPIVLVMGLMGSGRAWYRLLPWLVESRRAIVVDNRGTGGSSKPLGRWSTADMARDAIAVMDALEVPGADVLGASLGGMIAQRIALDHPDRLRSLVLACTRAGGRSGSASSWRMLASLALRPVLGPGRTFPIVAPALYAQRTRAHDPARVAEDLRMRVEDATPFHTAVGQLHAAATHDARRELRRIEAPTLVLHGLDDVLIPPSYGREIAEAVPGARLVEIPDAGHVLTTDAEREAATAILDFLDEVDASVGRP